MPLARRWSRRILATLAVIGVLLAPAEAMLHAQTVATHPMPAAGQTGRQSQATHPGKHAPHHRATTCCDLCVGGCSCTGGPLVAISFTADVAPLDGAEFAGALVPRLPSPQLLPHFLPFALAPPADGSA